MCKDRPPLFIAQFARPAAEFGRAARRCLKLVRLDHPADVGEQKPANTFFGTYAAYRAIEKTFWTESAIRKLFATAFATGGGNALPTCRYAVVFGP